MSKEKEKELALGQEQHQMAALKIEQIVNRTYLQTLSGILPVPCGEMPVKENVEESICIFPIKQFTYDKEENLFGKLASVYTGAAAANANPVFIVRGYASGMVELYLGVCGEESRINGAFPKAQILRESLIGQFPGLRSAGDGILPNDAARRTINSCFDPDFHALASVSCVASVENDQNAAAFKSRGLENLIESMSGREYTFIVLAQNVPGPTLADMRSELEGLYSQLSPLSKIALTLGAQDGITISQTVTDSISEGINQSNSVTLSVGTGEYASTSSTWGENSSFGMSNDLMEGMIGFSQSSGSSIGGGTSKGDSRQKTKSNGRVDGHAVNQGTAHARGDSKSLSSSQSVQYTIEDKQIENVLKTIEGQIERLKMGNGLGMFAVSAYCLAPALADARIGACAYKALVSGKESDMENTGINVWTGEEYQQVLGYLRRFRHPVFEITGKTENWEATRVTPATFVTAREMAVHMPLPQKAVNGIVVRDSVSFGRNVVSMNEEWAQQAKIRIGNIYHLGHMEKNDVFLLRDSLTMHTFITGTTGSGKSNALYWMLSELTARNEQLHFMVIEPAKGEYKDIFSDRKDVTVYGVNPYLSPLLRIDPFSFADGIHILEHLDRLMSIFTVCWPLYAAMPAVLKKAIISAYEDAGWNMRTSRNRYYKKIYPTFKDVMQYVERNIRLSNYSADTKGDYIGSLCTRLEALTDGFNGMIFAPNGILDEELFERNVIIDISRAGAAETKSLIMGMLVMKLQEYRMAGKRRSGLHHITVLEEAHHLLRRGQDSGEGAGIVGKSVEMLTHAIAEMRSAGEGFIIADQSPDLMDRSVIRNTNTKIVLRLPETEDRETVGRAIGLTNAQIAELPKLPCGVGAVYQNDWIEPVLVQIPYYQPSKQTYCYQMKSEKAMTDSGDGQFLDALMKNEVSKWLELHEKELEQLNLPSEVKRRLICLDSGGNGKDEKLIASIAWAYFNTQTAFEKAGAALHNNFEAWSERFAEALQPPVWNYSLFEVRCLIMRILRSHAAKNASADPLYLNYCSWMREQYLKKESQGKGGE